MTKRLTNEQFKERANIKHNGKYIYTETEYVDNKTPVKIICPIHGVFEQTPNSHLQGKGCQKCGHEATNEKNRGLIRSEEIKKKLCELSRKYTNRNYTNNFGRKKGTLGYTSESFIAKVKKMYGDKYIFDKIEYRGATKNIEVICPKHGSFPITPAHLLEGRSCPKCNCSKLEEEIKELLTENNIEYVEQYKNKGLRRLKIDFFLPQYNIGIECQGEQHFMVVEHFGGEEDYKKRVDRDLRKKQYCKELGINLIYFMRKLHDIKDIKCFTEKEELLRYIKENNLDI